MTPVGVGAARLAVQVPVSLASAAQSIPDECVEDLEDSSPGRSLLEEKFPFVELSKLAVKSRRVVDPKYGAHRWWARRPPSVMRGILLASTLPESATLRQFWEHFEKADHVLKGKAVLDPFAGGGSTLVEAARLGATPYGFDVDPLAVLITCHELDDCDTETLRTYGDSLLKHLRTIASRFYPPKSGWTPLHYFTVALATCPHCGHESPMYRDLVVARDPGLAGSVVREAGLSAFCPDCWKVHHFEDCERKTLNCCGAPRKLYEGTFTAQRFRCPHCGVASKHCDLLSGVAPRRIVAIEETKDTDYRRIRKPTKADLEALDRASKYFKRVRRTLLIPENELERVRNDSRPISFGITYAHQMFTDRQLIVFGAAFKWLATTPLPPSVHRALSLALSNALTTNNRLCGYARDYGRISALFSVRSYSLPLLAVELNPLHESGGRGTLARVLERLYRAGTHTIRRYVWDADRGRPKVTTTTFEQSSESTVKCAAITDERCDKPRVDLCVFDPPYFDYIAYSELSEFHRLWLQHPGLGGKPLLPRGSDPVASFAEQFGRCLRAAAACVREGGPLAFTFHSADPSAWESVGRAIDYAELRVTGLWPVLNDEHMGHHTAAGNCEWDLVVVCRTKATTQARFHQLVAADWRKAVHPLRVSKADRNSMDSAIKMAARRWGASEASLKRSAQ